MAAQARLAPAVIAAIAVVRVIQRSINRNHPSENGDGHQQDSLHAQQPKRNRHPVGRDQQRYSTEVQQRPLTVASQHERQRTELAGTIAKRPAAPLVRDEEVALDKQQRRRTASDLGVPTGSQTARLGRRAGRTRTASTVGEPVSLSAGLGVRVPGGVSRFLTGVSRSSHFRADSYPYRSSIRMRADCMRWYITVVTRFSS